MYALLGFESALASMETALTDYGMKTQANTISSIKFLYNRWLAHRCGDGVSTLGSTPELIMQADDEKLLLAYFIESVDKDDCLDAITPAVVEQTVASRQPQHIARCLTNVESARAELHQLCTDWGILFDLYINRVFCADIENNAGGSNGNAIGVMWVNLPDHTALVDVIEFCIHELTHHMIFVDQHAYGHYRNDGAHCRAKSAIRGALRPLPAAFDSLLVALEILYFRVCVSPITYQASIHPRTKALCDGIEQCLQSIQALQQKQALLSDRGQQLFHQGMELYESMLRVASHRRLNHYVDA